MGGITSRQNVGVEEVDLGANHAYRYPPKSGNYFSSHFIMGGQRFDTALPEMYLFGENVDLNFLGSRPAPFPYPAPSASEPSRTLKALVNIRKESLRFVKVPDESLGLKEPENRTSSTHYNVEFTFDCDVRCSISIMYFCTEEVSTTGLTYTPRDASMNSEKYYYKRGANQQFSQVCHIFDPSQYEDDDLVYSFDREIAPIVIYCKAEEGEDPFQTHATIAIIEKHSDDFVIKPLKQKLFVDGLCYLLQEIYGIENKNPEGGKSAPEEDLEDNGAECVICMCDLRDTLILPCRHLCLCNCCANSLRYQANNCPICRAPFRALLQIKALQKGGTGESHNNEPGESIPPGYECVSLIEALNGPSVAPAQPLAPPTQDMYIQLPQTASDSSPHEGSEAELEKATPGLEDSTTQTDKSGNLSSDSKDASAKVYSVGIGSCEDFESNPKDSSASSKHKKKRSRYVKDDSVTCISEVNTNNKEGNESSKKNRKSIGSPTSPSEQNPIQPVTVLSLSPTQKESDDIDVNETLGLLDSPSIALKSVAESMEKLSMKRTLSIDATGDKDVDSTSENISVNTSEDQQSEGNGMYSIKNEDGDKECGDDRDEESNRLKPIRSSAKSYKPHRSSSRKSKSSLGGCGGHLSMDNYDTNGADAGIEQNNESQSLPGTPLSHSSVMSHMSDASGSSASSTRALIISHPSQSSSSAI